jgi:hypothetical protein
VLVQRASTTVDSSSFCLHTAVVSDRACAVLRWGIHNASHFTEEVYLKVHFVYDFCNHSYTSAVVKYRQSYHIGKHVELHAESEGEWRLVPSQQQMQKLKNSVLEKAIILWQLCNGNQVQASAELLGPDIVVGIASCYCPGRWVDHPPPFRTTGITDKRIWRIVRHHGFHPYHLHRVQHLLPGSHTYRVRCCEWLKPRLRIVPEIVFTDKAQCTWDNITNTRNSHTWVRKFHTGNNTPFLTIFN